jgi:hypothetical protein
MRIHAIYVMIHDGRCIFNYPISPTAPPPQLVTGMLSALEIFVQEITGDFPNYLQTGALAFYLNRTGPITIVLTTSKDTIIKNELSDLSLRFMQKFSKKLSSWSGNALMFNDFRTDVVEILGEKPVAERINPVDPLSAFKLLELPEKLVDVAKALIQIKEGTAVDVMEINGKTEYMNTIRLEELVRLGHVGRYIQKDMYYYFTS